MVAYLSLPTPPGAMGSAVLDYGIISWEELMGIDRRILLGSPATKRKKN